MSQLVTSSIKSVMEKSYIDYAMYVILQRALPDVRDGLKPVHRRVLYSMFESGMTSSKPYKKSARMVGNVIGKYHPHGDTAVYETAVLMAQDFSSNHPFIDGQGNFGSIDGDNAAAMRYTEMRLDKISTNELFSDLMKDTVDWRENYDGSEQEPETLTPSFPSLLVNGIEGIAVGMAGNIPPHNLSSVIDAAKLLMSNEDVSTVDLVNVLKAPDFPTAGLVYDLDGFANAIETGRGRVMLRSKWHEEQQKRSSLLVIDELPYQVNKVKLIEKIVSLVKEDNIEGISGIQDESGKQGMRLVINVKKDSSPEVVFSQLCRLTQAEVSINYNCTVISNGKPVVMGLADIIKTWISFRREVVKKRYIFDRKKAMARLHLFEGYMRAIENMDEVVKLIRGSKSGAEAKPALMSLLDIDEIQSQAILDLRLQKLTGMELDSIKEEHASISEYIAKLTIKIENSDELDKDIIEELNHVKSVYGVERRTEIGHGISSVEREDLIPKEDVLISMTRGGYIKRMPINALSVQNRGTRGKKSVETHDEDEVRAMYQVNSHDMLLIIGQSGQIYGSKAYSIPQAKLTDIGRHIKNVIEGFDEEIQSVLAVPESSDTTSIVSLTRNGMVKRSGLSNYSGSTRKGGVKGMNMSEDDELFGTYTCEQGDTLIVVSSAGLAVHFEIDKLRMASRTSGGVTGIRLKDGESIIGAYVVKQDCDKENTHLFCLGERGIGKRTPISEFGVKGRGGKGMAAFKTTEKTGPLAVALGVTEEQDVVMSSHKGISNKIEVTMIAKTGRATSGVKLMNLDSEDTILTAIASVKSIEKIESDLESLEGLDDDSSQSDIVESQEIQDSPEIVEEVSENIIEDISDSQESDDVTKEIEEDENQPDESINNVEEPKEKKTKAQSFLDSL